jgi:addiction module HigA family antidote
MTPKLKFPHPGTLLREEFLDPMKITPYRLAKDIHVPPTRIAEILAGRRAITADTGLRLDRYFGLSEGYWVGLQTDYDLRRTKTSLASELEAIHPLRIAVA